MRVKISEIYLNDDGSIGIEINAKPIEELLKNHQFVPPVSGIFEECWKNCMNTLRKIQ
jgi:hypothetical protein